MDQYIEDLISNEVVFEVTLPVLPKRRILEANEELKPRVSILEADISDDSEVESDNAKHIAEGFNKESKENSEDESVDEEYANINLDKFDINNNKYEKSDSDSESDYSASAPRNKKSYNKNYSEKDKKTSSDKYLNKKRHKEKEQEKETEQSNPKVDENSVEYWMNLRKKLGIN